MLCISILTELYKLWYCFQGLHLKKIKYTEQQHKRNIT